jgi:hypothetical protein
MNGTSVLLYVYEGYIVLAGDKKERCPILFGRITFRTVRQNKETETAGK